MSNARLIASIPDIFILIPIATSKS